VCFSQVSQVVQKAPSQPRAGEVAAGRAGGGDGDAQRRQPRRADDTDRRQVIGIRQPGDQHERSGVRGDVGSAVGGWTAEQGSR